ncbi:MAG: hypothetical protein WAU91_22275, partial [Desulfatitalea sp.]
MQVCDMDKNTDQLGECGVPKSCRFAGSTVHLNIGIVLGNAYRNEYYSGQKPSNGRVARISSGQKNFLAESDRKRSQVMAYTIDQIEKHTIVLRLAVSIYKMNEAELVMLLDALADRRGAADELASDVLMKSISGKNDSVRRQMIIAKIFVLINQLDKNSLLDRLAQLSHPGFQWVREYPRLSCLLLIDFAAKGKAYRSCIRDISAKGMFIETSE